MKKFKISRCNECRIVWAFNIVASVCIVNSERSPAHQPMLLMQAEASGVIFPSQPTQAFLNKNTHVLNGLQTNTH